MKIVDLIKKLQDLESRHGNLEITIMHADTEEEQPISSQSICFWNNEDKTEHGFHIWTD